MGFSEKTPPYPLPGPYVSARISVYLILVKTVIPVVSGQGAFWELAVLAAKTSTQARVFFTVLTGFGGRKTGSKIALF